jgi:phosphoglycolate phosphatase-like HAD superfamily hydrolase
MGGDKLYVKLDEIRKKGIKVCVNTGYPRLILDKLIEGLHFKPHIDGSASSDDVGQVNYVNFIS